MSRQETKRKIKQGENGWGCGLLPMTCIPQTHPHLPQLRGGDDGGWEVRKKERWGVSEDRDVQDQSPEGKASSFFPLPCFPQASQVVLVVKNPPANAGFVRDKGSIPGSGRSPGERNGNPPPVFLPRKSHGQSSLAGYSRRGCKKVRPNLATKTKQNKKITLIKAFGINNF